MDGRTRAWGYGALPTSPLRSRHRIGNLNYDLFAERMRACWSSHTATVYSDENPARGQCSVTALLAQEELGGELLRTRVGEAWHFYNYVRGEQVDFTSGQFREMVTYDDIAATRGEAMADTSSEQLGALRSAFQKQGARE